MSPTSCKRNNHWILLLACCCCLNGIVQSSSLSRLSSFAAQGQLNALTSQRLARYMSLQRIGSSQEIAGLNGQMQPLLAVSPACLWTPSPSKDEPGLCMPSFLNWLLLPAVPSSPKRRADLAASQIHAYCAKTHKTKAACLADQRHRCVWDPVPEPGKSPACASGHLYELGLLALRGFNATPGYLTPLMTCPGTLANMFATCWNHIQGKDACQFMPQCTSHKTELGEQLCGPKFLNKMTLQEADDFVKGLASWTEDIYGKCDAVCWLRQARECLKLDGTDEKKCQAKKYCTWSADEKSCTRHTFEMKSDDDKKGMCLEIDNQEDCEANKAPAISEAVRAKWRNYTASSEAVTCKL